MFLRREKLYKIRLIDTNIDMFANYTFDIEKLLYLENEYNETINKVLDLGIIYNPTFLDDLACIRKEINDKYNELYIPKDIIIYKKKELFYEYLTKKELLVDSNKLIECNNVEKDYGNKINNLMGSTNIKIKQKKRNF